MNFNKHYALEGKHAFLGASQYHWINYDEDKLITSYTNYKAKERGTELHKFAYDAIRLQVPLDYVEHTLNKYVNDAIYYGMTPEVVLYFSENCFGTADAVYFDGKLLRIHDLKTGKTPASFNQLLVYSALFCLEYDVNPIEIEIELRIYQLDEVLKLIPDPNDILVIMDKIIVFDRIIKDMRQEGRF